MASRPRSLSVSLVLGYCGEMLPVGRGLRFKMMAMPRHGDLMQVALVARLSRLVVMMLSLCLGNFLKTFAMPDFGHLGNTLIVARN